MSPDTQPISDLKRHLISFTETFLSAFAFFISVFATVFLDTLTTSISSGSFPTHEAMVTLLYASAGSAGIAALKSLVKYLRETYLTPLT